MSFSGVEVRPGPGTRALMPGPCTGFYEVLSFSIGTLASGEIGQPQYYLGTHARVVAVGWYAPSIGGGANSTFMAGNPATPTTALLGNPFFSVDTIDGLTSKVYRTLGTTPTLDDDRIRSGAAGNPLWLRFRVVAGTNAIADLTVWALLWRTGYISVNTALD